jgi:hypothetical protein
MNAKTPEETKKIAPWLGKKEIEQKVSGIETNKLPKGIALPPYHFRCRTRTVTAYKNEINTNIAEEGLTHDDIIERTKSKLINYQSFNKDEIVKLIEIAKKSKWENKKVKESDKYSAQHHYEKHKKELASENMAQYNSEAIELFRNPKRELHIGMQRDNLFMIAYSNNRFGLINLSTNELLTFHERNTDSYGIKLNTFNNLIKLQSQGIYKRALEWILKN